MKQPNLLSEKDNIKVKTKIVEMNARYSSFFKIDPLLKNILKLNKHDIKMLRQEDENKRGRSLIIISPVSGYDVAIWKNILRIAVSQNFWEQIWKKAAKSHSIPKFYDAEMLTTPSQDKEIQKYVASTREKKSSVKKGPYWPVVAPDANSYCIYDTDTQTILKSMFRCGKKLARKYRDEANKKNHKNFGGLLGNGIRMRFVIRKPASLGISF